MGRRYSAVGNQTTSSSAKTIWLLGSTTAVRPRVYDFIIGSDATPADVALRFFLQRNTDLGTGTTFTAIALDNGDPAAATAVRVNHSAEPTYTANSTLFEVAMNQRSTQRWVAAPGSEIVCPATANNGVGLQVIHASATPTVRSTAWFEE